MWFTLTELWRHYLGLRTIAEERPKTFSVSTESNVDLDNLIVGNGLDYPYNFPDNPDAAGNVVFTGSEGTDTISLTL